MPLGALRVIARMPVSLPVLFMALAMVSLSAAYPSLPLSIARYGLAAAGAGGKVLFAGGKYVNSYLYLATLRSRAL